MKIRFHSLMWGEEYCDIFIKLTLPSVVADKNIFFENECVYAIYTTPNDYKYMEKGLEELKKLAQVEFIDLASIFSGSTFEIISKVFEHSIKACFNNKQIMRNIPCDSIFSKDAFTNSFKPIKDGKKAVFMPTGALRIDLYSTMEELGDGFKGLDSKELYELFINNMHEETRSHFANSTNFFHSPCQILSRDDKGITVKSFFTQPYFLSIEKETISFTNPEWDLINNLYDDLKEVYFIKDSEEAFEVALTKKDYTRHWWNTAGLNQEVIKTMISKYANDFTTPAFEQGYLIK